MLVSVIPTHLKEEMDGFCWTVTHWCTKEGALSMHGPQGRVKQEIGSEGCHNRNEESINDVFFFKFLLKGGGGSFEICLPVSREIQQVMFETAGDVRKVRAGWPVFRVSEKILSLAPELRVIAQYWRAHWPQTFSGGGLKEHMVFEAHTHTHTHSFIDKVTRDRTKPKLLPLLIDCDVFLEARLPAAHSRGSKPSMI